MLKGQISSEQWADSSVPSTSYSNRLGFIYLRYLSRTYKHAYSSVQPDVVIFLGDLLDEGSIASDVEYQGYVDRFNVIFNSTGYAKVFAYQTNLKLSRCFS